MFILRLLLILAVFLFAYSVAVLSFLVPYFGCAVLAVIILMMARKRSRTALREFGTARWAGIADLWHMLEGDGIIIGTVEDYVRRSDGFKALFSRRLPANRAVRRYLDSVQRKPRQHLLRLTNAVHTMAVAPTGVGKGVSIVLPFLLACRDSCIVLDYKGENAALTMHARRKMGHTCVVIDPFKAITNPPDTFNPIGTIDPESDTALDEIRDAAEALVVTTGQEKDPHWNAMSLLLITGLVAAVVAFADPGDRNLQSVRLLLTSTERMTRAVEAMCASDKWGGMLRRLGAQIQQIEGKELSSVLTTTNRHMNFLDTLAVADNTRASNWDPHALLTGKVTVYLVLPPAHQRSQAPLLRLWISALLRTVVNGGLSNRKVHLVLDEAASLGYLPCLEDAVDKYRGYGLRLLFLYQSLGQIRTCWPDGRDQTLLSNVTKIFFGINDYQTAEMVSNLLGNATEVLTSGGTGTSRSYQSADKSGSSSSSTSTNDNWALYARKLLEPAEVLNLEPSVAITFTPGVPPIASRLIRYFDREFKKPQRLGLLKVTFDTACLFGASLLLAVISTGALLKTFK